MTEKKTLADRPRWGPLLLPVPYVARWSEELDMTPFGISVGADGQPLVAYKNESMLDRDSHGILWMRERYMGKGKGEPQFAQLSTRRQRSCMQKKLCQMCGGKLEAPYNFLMGPGQLDEYNRLKGVTMNPPVCGACLLQAPTLCPHLRHKGSTRIVCDDFARVGVYGDVAVPTAQGIERGQGPVLDGHPVLTRFVVARQMIVLLHNPKVG